MPQCTLYKFYVSTSSKTTYLKKKTCYILFSYEREFLKNFKNNYIFEDKKLVILFSHKREFKNDVLSISVFIVQNYLKISLLEMHLHGSLLLYIRKTPRGKTPCGKTPRSVILTPAWSPELRLARSWGVAPLLSCSPSLLHHSKEYILYRRQSKAQCPWKETWRWFQWHFLAVMHSYSRILQMCADDRLGIDFPLFWVLKSSCSQSNRRTIA